VPHVESSVPGMQVVPEQQPFGHEVASHTQAPPTQRWPAVQAAPLAPQEQVPPARHRSAVTPHAVHAPPAVPQLATEAAWQALPEQQPPAHETPSQTQLPCTQCSPGAQAAPAPHTQLPAAEQPSARVPSQTPHAPPPLPHEDGDGVWQLPPAQQPLGHELASHTQWPPRQCWPAPQAGPAPQTQAPEAEQPSARFASHPTHATPPLPQVVSEGTLHVAPEQQPFGQLMALHPLQAPELHICPAGQVSQRPPPVPHEAGVSPARQIPLAQQPFGQEVPSHTQVLPMQRCPGRQAAPAPQRQVPFDEQLSAWASQATQVEPAFPQVASERVSQALPWQQPLGHEVASHTHSPETQRCPPAHACPAPHAHVPPAAQ
jgi:hypothetical protein